MLDGSFQVNKLYPKMISCLICSVLSSLLLVVVPCTARYESHHHSARLPGFRRVVEDTWHDTVGLVKCSSNHEQGQHEQRTASGHCQLHPNFVTEPDGSNPSKSSR